ncbi:aldo/keto reductase [Streptomyces sp. N2-109]|uniref:Aldo/keto reductase n=1 Tax=Streptomyces gossypii TaxID=2883101 RepID=A0ABT2JQV3_9ACTN|nr:aldo/keto reductase [Streptomyces gossypii]MCT2589864.1 aldo/keto reductase [Streptomyces gossypii]
MRYRLLGRTGLRISEVFLGAMAFGGGAGRQGGASLEECRRMIDLYADAGGNALDTAVNYRGGASESILGELLEGRRDRFVLSTKYTMTRDGTDPNASGNHRKNLTRSLETSLRQLRTDHIDLYWAHLWDRHTPVEETMRALDDAVRAGKILYVGMSDAPAWVVAQANTLAEWRGWTPFAGLQVPYNMLNRDVERELLPMAEAFGMTVTTWSPLAHGLLSGRKPRPAGPPGHTSELSDRELTAVRVLEEVADELGHSPAQVAIAWVRSRSRAIHPILGASSAEQLRDNLGALDVVLPPEAAERLTSAVDFALGFPGDFIGGAEPSPLSEAETLLDGRR